MVLAVILTEECTYARDYFRSSRRTSAAHSDDSSRPRGGRVPDSDSQRPVDRVGCPWGHQSSGRGPGVYARPAGVSNDTSDDVCVYQAILLMPGGIGSVVWSAEEYSEYLRRDYGQQTDLRDRFMPYERLPAIVRALIVKHADKMVESLLRDIRVMEP